MHFWWWTYLSLGSLLTSLTPAHEHLSFPAGGTEGLYAALDEMFFSHSLYINLPFQASCLKTSRYRIRCNDSSLGDTMIQFPQIHITKIFLIGSSQIQTFKFHQLSFKVSGLKSSLLMRWLYFKNTCTHGSSTYQVECLSSVLCELPFVIFSLQRIQQLSIKISHLVSLVFCDTFSPCSATTGEKKLQSAPTVLCFSSC